MDHVGVDHNASDFIGMEWGCADEPEFCVVGVDAAASAGDQDVLTTAMEVAGSCGDVVADLRKINQK